MIKPALLLIAAACALTAQIDEQKEAALGKALAAEVSRSVTALDSAPVHDYVESLARRLAPAEWRITVVTDDLGGSTHEPVSLPGGYLFVPVKLILESRSEAEFAGMLAHAMAHILNRDGLEARPGNGSIPLVYVGGPLGAERGVAMPAGLLPRQRQFELAADARAARMMTEAGFPPSALSDYLDRTQTEGGTRSGLPLKSDRIAALQAARSDFEKIRAELQAAQPPAHRTPPSLREK